MEGAKLDSSLIATLIAGVAYKRKMTQWVQCLLLRCEVLGSDLQPHVKAAIAAHFVSLSVVE